MRQEASNIGCSYRSFASACVRLEGGKHDLFSLTASLFGSVIVSPLKSCQYWSISSTRCLISQKLCLKIRSSKKSSVNGEYESIHAIKPRTERRYRRRELNSDHQAAQNTQTKRRTEFLKLDTTARTKFCSALHTSKSLSSV